MHHDHLCHLCMTKTPASATKDRMRTLLLIQTATHSLSRFLICKHIHEHFSIHDKGALSSQLRNRRKSLEAFAYRPGRLILNLWLHFCSADHHYTQEKKLTFQQPHLAEQAWPHYLSACITEVDPGIPSTAFEHPTLLPVSGVPQQLYRLLARAYAISPTLQVVTPYPCHVMIFPSLKRTCFTLTDSVIAEAQLPVRNRFPKSTLSSSSLPSLSWCTSVPAKAQC